MTDGIQNRRDEVIHRFCRTILWIDDEIHLEKGLAEGGLFKKKMDEFIQSHLLCHMQGFPEARSGNDPYAEQPEVEAAIKSCVSLARQADIVIVDWRLGSSDSSEYAKKIIRSLLGVENGFRFIVVLSKEAPEDGAFTELDDSFEKCSSSVLWKNRSGQFVVSLRKDEFRDAHLFDQLRSCLLEIYPDYLHVAALEIAGRIKELSPRWLSSIPANTDLGLLLERGNTFQEESWRDNLQECVASNLLEDLRAVILGENLVSLKEDALMPSSNPSVDFPDKEGEIQNALYGLKTCLRDDKPVPFSPKLFKKLLKEKSDPEIAGLLVGIEKFTEFCEVQSVVAGASHPSPGAVYAGLSQNKDDIAVCISGGCDCLRSPSLLFLVGSRVRDMAADSAKTWPEILEDKKIHGGKTILRFGGQVYLFHSTASSLISKDRAEVSTITPLGFFRKDIVNRLASRFMTHIRRVGVNQPYISRDLRGEKKLDE